MIAGLLEAYALKEVARTGWQRRGVADAESVAAHSWGVALLALALAPPELDRARCLTYAVLHDLAEARTGDLTPEQAPDRAAKHAAEAAAMRDLCADLPGGAALLSAWEAYERQEDAESRFVRQLDRLDMALQAARYHAIRGLDPSDFLRSAGAVIEAPELRALLGACQPGGQLRGRPDSK